MKISEINLHGPFNTIGFKILRDGLPGHRLTVSVDASYTGDKQAYLQAEIDRQLVGFDEKPDLTEIFALAELCFCPDMDDKVTIREDKTVVAGGVCVFPGGPATGNIQAVCDIVHTPELKLAYAEKMRPAPRQMTQKVLAETARIEVRDGKAVRIVETKEVDQPVFIDMPVVDTLGNPVMVMISQPIYDKTGKVIKAAVYKRAIHKEPVMEAG